MEWATSITGDALVARPAGRVDETSWEAFLAHLTAAVAETAADGTLILDLEGIDYMSSRGLRALTIARRDADAKGVTLTLARPNPRMREILAISRYDKIFPVVDAIDPAL